MKGDLMTRRDFVRMTAGAGLAAGVPGVGRTAEGVAFKTRLQKALIAGIAIATVSAT
mgnify:CR=1 FL=1